MGEEPKIPFGCRICGNTEYEEITDHNGVMGPGFQEWRVFCVCKGCSAIFADPKKFSVYETGATKQEQNTK